MLRFIIAAPFLFGDASGSKAPDKCNVHGVCAEEEVALGEEVEASALRTELLQRSATWAPENATQQDFDEVPGKDEDFVKESADSGAEHPSLEQKNASLSTPDYCTHRHVGYFCWGTTHVRCCRSGPFLRTCGTVVHHGSCGFQLGGGIEQPSNRNAVTLNITSAVASNVEANSTYPYPTYGPRESWMTRLSFLLPIVVVIFFASSKMCTTSISVGRDIDAFELGEVLLSLLLYVVSGPALIMLNKHTMKEHNFHFPFFIVSLGNILLMVVTRAMVALKVVTLDDRPMEWGRYIKVVVLMGVMNLVAQVAGTASYLFVSVPEIQILKCMTMVMVMVLATACLKEPISLFLVVSVFVIAAGSCLSAVFDEGDGRVIGSKASARAIGLLLCFLAGASEATRTICSQVLMDGLKVFDGVYWSQPAFTVLALFFMVLVELKRLVHHPFGALAGPLVLNALLTTLIVPSNLWFVKLVGALVMKVAAQGRSIALVLVSVAFFQEHCNAMQYLGYAVSLLGIAMVDKAKANIRQQAAGDLLTQLQR